MLKLPNYKHYNGNETLLYRSILGLFSWILKDYEQPLPKAKKSFWRWDSEYVKQTVFSGAPPPWRCTREAPYPKKTRPEKTGFMWLSACLYDTCTARAEPSPIPWKLKESSTITMRNLWYCMDIQVIFNWQLSKQGNCWPVLCDHVAQARMLRWGRERGQFFGAN